MITSSSWRWSTPQYVDRPSHQVELADIAERLNQAERTVWFWRTFGHMFPGGRDPREIVAEGKQDEARLKKRRREILASYGHEDDEQTAEVVSIADDADKLRVLTKDLESAISKAPEHKPARVPAILRYWWLLPAAFVLLMML